MHPTASAFSLIGTCSAWRRRIFVAENIDTDSTVPLVLDSYDPLTYTATLSFPQAQFNTGILENGNYQVRLLANSVTSASDGQPLAEEYTLAFWFLNGDADRSRGVNAADYAIIDASYSYQQQHGVPPEGWSWDDGDFDYSGSIDAADYSIIDNGYFVHLYEPTDFYVTALSSSSIRLAWDDVQGEDTWRIQRSTDGANFVWYQDLPANTTTFDDTNLGQGTRYWYRVRGVGPGGFDTGASAKQAATTVLPVPDQVIVTAGASPDTAVLTWRDNSSNESEFIILRGTPGGVAEQVATVAAEVTTYTITGLTETSDFSYRVRAVNAQARSSDSLAATLPATEVLGGWSPSGLRATAAFVHDPAPGTGVPLRPHVTVYFSTPISPSTFNTSYLRLVELKTDTAFAAAELGIAIDPAGQVATITFPSRTITFLGGATTFAGMPDGDYQLRIPAGSVRATNGDYLSEEVSVEFIFYAGDANQDRAVNIADLYAVASHYDQTGVTFAEGDLNYDGVVNQTDLDIVSLRWQQQWAAAPAMQLRIASAYAYPGGIHLMWSTAAFSPTVQEWEIWRADSVDGVFVKAGTAVGWTWGEYFDRSTAVISGEDYFYRIRAVFDKNNGVFSSWSAVRAAVTRVQTPTLWVADTTQTRVNLDWQTGMTGTYEVIKYRADGYGNFVQAGTSGLVDGHHYRFKIVVRRNGYIVSPESNIVDAYTKPGKPSVVSVTDTGYHVRVRWRNKSYAQPTVVIERKEDTPDAVYEELPGGVVPTTYDQEFEYRDYYGLRPGTSYRYRVVATTAAHRIPSVEWSVTTSTESGYTAPENLQLSTPYPGAVKLTWEHRSYSQVRYEIRRRPVGGTFADVTSVGPLETTWTDVNAAQGVAYEYRVATNGSQWAWASAGPITASPFGAPIGGVRSGGKAYLNWGSAKFPAGFTFTVEQSASAGGPFTPVTTASASVALVDGALQVSPPQWTTKYFRVKASSGTNEITSQVAAVEFRADGDADEDGLTNTDEYNTHHTDMFYFDTDRDMLPDGWEVRYGLNPTNSNQNSNGLLDGDDDFDGDGVTNLSESNHSSNPTTPDSDTDGTSDLDEINQGSNPADGADGGLAPPDDMKAKLTVGVGDKSGSHSERWALNVGSIAHTAPLGSHRSDDYYFRPGQSYPIRLEHLGSSLSSPDYDWSSRIEPAAGSAPVPYFVIDDNTPALMQPWNSGNDGLGESYSQDPYQLFIGHSATVHVPLLDVDVDSDNNSGFTLPLDNEAEDRLEQDSTKGKIVWATTGDMDGDGIVDRDDLQINARHFTPMVLRLSGNLQDAQPTQIKFTFAYEPTVLRIWKLDAPMLRTGAEVIGSGSPQTLNLQPGGTLPLYIEALNDAVSALPITVTAEVTGNTWSGVLQDTVHVQPVDLKLLIGANDALDESLHDDWVGAKDTASNRVHTINNFLRADGPQGLALPLTVDVLPPTPTSGTVKLIGFAPNGTQLPPGPVTGTLTLGNQGYGVDWGQFFIEGDRVSAATEDVKVQVIYGGDVIGAETLTVIRFNAERETYGGSSIPVNPGIVTSRGPTHRGNLFAVDIGTSAASPGTNSWHLTGVRGGALSPETNGSYLHPSRKIRPDVIEVTWARVLNPGPTQVVVTSDAPASGLTVNPADNAITPVGDDNLRMRDNGITPTMEAASSDIWYLFGHPSQSARPALAIPNNYAERIVSRARSPRTMQIAVHVMELQNAAGTTLASLGLTLSDVDEVVSDVNTVWSQAGIEFALNPLNYVNPEPVTDQTLFDVDDGYNPLQYTTDNVTAINNKVPAVDVYFVRRIGNDSGQGDVAGTTIYEGMSDATAGILVAKETIGENGAVIQRQLSQISRTLAHEIGHYLMKSAAHRSEAWNIMFVDSDIKLDIDDTQASQSRTFIPVQ